MSSARPPEPRRFARTGRRAIAWLLPAAALLCAAAPLGGAQRDRARAVMLPRGPKIDAELSDPLWQRASPLQLHPVPGKEGNLSTSVRLLFDAANLYAAIECEEPDPTLHAKARERDEEVWADDCVELYVLPHPKVGYKQIAVNPLGTLFDQSFRPGGRGDRTWNADVKVAVSRQPGKGWKVALSVPHKDLGAYAGADQTWRLNVTRLRKARGEAPQQEYTWSLLPSAEFHQPDAFGAIEHIDIPVQAGGVTRRIEEFRSGLAWARLRAVRGVRRVLPHPLDPDVAWCATAGGLLVTNDNGDTWAPVASAAADAVGEVACLAVSTRDPQTLCLGSDTRGLFLSRDGGRTWSALGSGAERCASDHVEWVEFCPSDPSGRTLLATHGLAAPGLSISRNLGATWEVFGRDRFLKRFVKQGETLVAVGSMIVTEGKVWGIHRSGTDGLRWEETMRNIHPAVPAATAAARWQFLVSTLDGTILQSFNDGKSWGELVRSEGSSWTSLFFTNAPTAKSQVLAAYDPHRQGLCLSRHRFANGLGERPNRGLYIGPYVKSGASCVANANGTVYYVAMNNGLWIGRWELPAHGPAVVRARCLPCSVRVDNAAMARAQEELHRRVAAIASDEPVAEHLGPIAAAARAIDRCKAAMSFTVLAEVRHPRGPGGIRRVTADVSALGGSRAEPLHDDGRHDDGKAGDGVFAAAVPFSPAVLERQDFREELLLTVTAADADGASDTWPAVVNIPRGPAAVGLMRGGWDSERTEGPVTVGQVRDEAAHAKNHVLRFAASGPGPWRAAWLMPGDGVNSAGLKWLTFRIRGDTDQELFVHLVDFHRIGTEGFFDEPHFSRPEPLIAGGYLKAVTPEYQEVRIPIDKLLPKGLLFLRWHTAGIGLSVPKGGRSGTYHVGEVQIEP